MEGICKRIGDILSGATVSALVLLLFLSMLLSTAAASGTEVTPVADELAPIGTKSEAFYYNDKLLLDRIGSTDASGEISLASVGLAVAAYDQEDITNTVEQMGFKTLFVSKYYSEETTHDNNDVVAFSVSEKYVSYNGETYRILLVPIRGTPSSCEWYSDFNIGTGDQHYGFYTAASEILGQISSLIHEPAHSVDHTVLWTMGHSRGAAVANIVAGEISTDSSWRDVISKDYVFGYTYACPAVSLSADTSLHNIWNYNNGGDVVPALPLADWGYKRFGQTRILPESDYDNLCHRFKAVKGEDYVVGMTTIAWEEALKDISATKDDFVGNDTVQLAVDLLSWGLGGQADSSYGPLEIFLDHPSAQAELTATGLKTTLFPLSTLQNLTVNMTIADLQFVFDSDMRDYLDLETSLEQAIIDTAEMRDHDSADEEAHKKYVEWCNWLSGNGLVNKTEDMTNIVIQYKSDLHAAHKAAGDRYTAYHDIVTNIRDILALYYDTEGNLGAAFTQAHPQDTYQLWVNSMYYGYEGWYGSPDITTVNWAGRDQKTYVGMRCFQDCENLESVVAVPDHMMIGDCAFYDCDCMTQLDLAGEGITISDSAFYSCGNLTHLTIPDSINKIERYAFASCGIENLSAPYEPECYDIYTIDGSNTAFAYCPVKNLTITKGRTGDYYDIPHTYIWPEEKITHITVAEGVKSLGKDMFGNHGWYRYQSLQELELPSTLRKINNNVFSGSFLTDQGSVVKYHGTLSSWCNLDLSGAYSNPLCSGNTKLCIDDKEVVDIVIPENINVIKPFAFYNYSGLKTLVIPEHVTEIDVCAFYSCKNLEKVSICGSASIGGAAFSNCESLSDLQFIGEKNTIGDNAFYNCSGLRNLIIPDSINYIGREAFEGCGIESLSAPNNPEKYDGYCFKNCSITNLTVTKGVDGEYYDTYSSGIWPTDSITHVTVAEGVKSLGPDMFKSNYGYSSLQELELPSSLERINGSLFTKGIYCEQLSAVKYNGTISSWCSLEFGDDYSNPLSNGCASLYIDNTLIVDLTIPDDISKIKPYAYYNYQGLKTLVIPEHVTEIDVCAFYSCKNLEKVSICGSASIGGAAFSNCESLSDLQLEGENISIDDWAFSCCQNLKNLVVPDSIEYVGQYAFEYCGVETLSAPYIPEKFNHIYCFKNCPIKNLTVTKGVDGEYYDAYSSGIWPTDSITHVTVAEGVKSLGTGMFSYTGYDNLQELELPSTLERINTSAFSQAGGKLTDVYYAGTENQWKSISIASGNDDLLNATIHYRGGQDPEPPVHGDNDHVWDAGTVTKPATATEEGVKTYTCTICGTEKTEMIPKLPAVPVPGDVTCDGDVTMADVVKVNRAVVGLVILTDEENVAADVTGDRDVTMADVVKLNRFVLGKIKSLAVASVLTTQNVPGVIITVGNSSVKAGEQTTIPVSLSGNPGLAGMALSFTIPDEVELDSITVGDALSDGTFTQNKNVITWYITGNEKRDGVILNLNVSAPQKPGKYTIQAALKDNKASNLTNESIESVGVTFEDGALTVEENPQNDSYGAPVWNWSDDFKNASAIFTNNESGDTQTVNAKVSEETTPATTSSEGKTIYTATVIFNGKNYTDTRTVPIPVVPKPEPEPTPEPGKQDNTITCSNVTKTYSIKKQTVNLKAKANGASLTYSSDNKSISVDKNGKVFIKAKYVGKATITITASETDSLLGATKAVTVTVKPTKTALSNVKWDKKKKVLNVQWKKNTSGKGYEVQYSTDKKFKKGNKTVKIGKYTTLKTTIKNLKKGTYYVRIRTMNGKISSDWSSAKTIKIAK